jgi:LuxR family maltose regulon positive regulatory protein
VPRLAALAAAQGARLALAGGDLPAASAWAEAEQFRRAAYGSDGPLHEFEDLTLARVFLAQGEYAAAAELLAPLLAAAQENGRGRAVIEALILLALAHEGQGQTAAAAAALRRALLPAAAEGFMRLFLDEGPALAALLPRARAAAPAFADDLLAAYDTAGALAPGSPAISSAARNLAPDSAPPTLTDPLSEREQEVLALLVAGLSNDDIAAELFITTGTAKWHVHNIYQKLDVGSRAQAIARAHEWRLI